VLYEACLLPLQLSSPEVYHACEESLKLRVSGSALLLIFASFEVILMA